MHLLSLKDKKANRKIANIVPPVRGEVYMKKLVLYTIVSFFVVCLLQNIPGAASTESLNKAEFVELFVRAIGLDIPEGSERLSDSEYYEVLTNILAVNGITTFIDTNPDNALYCEDMVISIYEMFGGKKELSVNEKMDFLVNNEFMPYCNPRGPVTLEFAIEVLNSPAFAKIIAEAYREPEERGAGLGAPGAAEEDPASLI